MRPPVSPTNLEASSRLDLRLREVVHLDEEPLPPKPLAGHVCLDDAPNHIGRDREIGGDALGRRRRDIALHEDCGFPFRRQGDPVMAEVRAIREKAQHSVFADIGCAIIERKRAVVRPQACHRVDIATVRKRSMVGRQQLEHLRLLRQGLAVCVRGLDRCDRLRAGVQGRSGKRDYSQDRRGGQKDPGLMV